MESKQKFIVRFAVLASDVLRRFVAVQIVLRVRCSATREALVRSRELLLQSVSFRWVRSQLCFVFKWQEQYKLNYFLCHQQVSESCSDKLCNHHPSPNCFLLHFAIGCEHVVLQHSCFAVHIHTLIPFFFPSSFAHALLVAVTQNQRLCDCVDALPAARASASSAAACAAAKLHFPHLAVECGATQMVPFLSLILSGFFVAMY